MNEACHALRVYTLATFLDCILMEISIRYYKFLIRKPKFYKNVT